MGTPRSRPPGGAPGEGETNAARTRGHGHRVLSAAVWVHSCCVACGGTRPSGTVLSTQLPALRGGAGGPPGDSGESAAPWRAGACAVCGSVAAAEPDLRGSHMHALQPGACEWAAAAQRELSASCGTAPAAVVGGVFCSTALPPPRLMAVRLILLVFRWGLCGAGRVRRSMPLRLPHRRGILEPGTSMTHN